MSLTVIAAVLSLLFAHRLDGVREGTIIAALLVGFIARLFGRRLSFLEPLLFRKNEKSSDGQTAAVPAAASVSKNASVSADDSASEPHTVIVIGRQYGSGGHDIGKELAEKLGFAFYDNEIISDDCRLHRVHAEIRTGARREYDEQFPLRPGKPDVYLLRYTGSSQGRDLESEGKSSCSLADQENCVILGRCADYFLRERPNCLKVYLHAPEDYRVKRIMDTENLSEEDARQKVRRMDRRRSDNYHYYTRRIWGHSKNYDLTIDTSIGAEAVEEIIRRTLELREKQKISS